MRDDRGGRVDGRNYKYESDYENDDTLKSSRAITEDTAERCLYFLAHSSEPHAAWSARRKFLDKYISIVLAMEESKSPNGSAADRTRKAKKSIPYMRVLRDLEEATYHEILLSGLRSAAEKKFSGWQTIMANARAGVNV